MHAPLRHHQPTFNRNHSISSMSPSDLSTHLHLESHDATLLLGARLARVMTGLGLFPALLLLGELGAGKTTFVRGLVQALPGGDQAEAASPSFNYMNSYPTRPETSHIDLYRLQHQGVDDELLEAMHDANNLVIVEWAEYCPEPHRPREHLIFHFTLAPQGRNLSIAARGANASEVLGQL